MMPQGTRLELKILVQVLQAQAILFETSEDNAQDSPQGAPRDGL